MTRAIEVIAGGEVTPKTLNRIEDTLYFDRGNVRDKYSRYFILLALSSIIATGGVVADSTAVVVGGMIIAPLMTPILAVSLSVVVGNGRNALRSLGLTIGSVFGVIAIAAIVARIAPGSTHIIGNVQIATRTTPRLIDLVIALAAGAAGAIAIVREDVADVLPGVAVSISLVPPLCVAGTAFTLGQPGLAWGALLLFATNFFAIQLAGGMVLTFAGLPRAARREANRHTRNIGLAVALVGTVFCVVPLAATSASVAQAVILENRAAKSVDQWLHGSAYESLSVRASGSVVTVQITGHGIPPRTADLATLLSGAKPRPSKVRVLVLPQEVQTPLEPPQVTAPTSETTVSAPSLETTPAGPGGSEATQTGRPATSTP